MNVNVPTVEEIIARLVIDDTLLFEWRCTPADLAALVIGRLYIEGLVDDASIATSLRVDTGAAEAAIWIPTLPVARQQRGSRVARAELPSADDFGGLFRELFAGVDARHEHGGMHAAALAREGRIEFQAEDVGRHNAVDKVIGKALLAEAEPAAHGLLISARISGEIARKAARAGVAWLASRSIPTTLAVQSGRDANLPIVGKAAGRHAVVYT